VSVIARPWDGNVARQRMTAWVDHFQAIGDGRALFLETYIEVTDGIARACQSGRFQDSQWVSGLAEHAADYYFLTVEPDTADPQHVPRAWLAAHSVASRTERSARDVLLLGLNAHINSDLPRAVCEMLSREWPLPRPSLDQRRADVFSLVDVVVDAAELRCSLKAISASWRTEVWENALSLTTAADRPWRRGIVESIECTANRRAHLIVCDIASRDDLLRVRAHELQRSFPLHHSAKSCRLAVPPPVWGEVTVATD
jgi:Family of unknown function (DUF5995)